MQSYIMNHVSHGDYDYDPLLLFFVRAYLLLLFIVIIIKLEWLSKIEFLDSAPSLLNRGVIILS